MDQHTHLNPPPIDDNRLSLYGQDSDLYADHNVLAVIWGTTIVANEKLITNINIAIA